MKKLNYYLFGLLILGLVATYFFQEKRALDENRKLELESKVLDFSKVGEILSIKGQKSEIVKEGDTYLIKETRYPVNSKRLEEVFKILGNIKVKSIVAGAEVAKIGHQNFIPDSNMQLSFVFANEEVIFTLGKKLDFDQSFYLEVQRGKKGQVLGREMLVAFDSSVDDAIYQSEAEMKKSDAKYRRLQAIFFLGNSFYNDLRIFKDRYAEDTISFKEVKFATFRNKKFSVDFEKTQTIPAPIPGIEYFSDNWISFYRMFIRLPARGIMNTYKQELLKEPLSIIEIKNRNGDSEEVVMYKKYGSLVGYFVVTNKEKTLFELDQDKARYFLLNIQDFWSKKIKLPGTVFDLSISAPSGEKLSLKVRDLDLFRAEGLSGVEANNVNVKKLVDFIKMEANHISLVESSDGDILKKIRFSFSLNNSLYQVFFADSDLIFLDVTKKVLYHYYVGNESPIDLELKAYKK